MSFATGSMVYNITTESELASVLSHFDSNFIFNIVKDNIANKYIKVYTDNPNIVISLEQNFKQIKDYYNRDSDQIEQVRQDTYFEIIDIICKEYGLQFNASPDIDLYSAALYLYDFLVANFSNYVAKFFAEFLYKERNMIYDSMNLASFKKNKDSSTLYGKKLYKDVKAAVINANLSYVLRNMVHYDITLDDIINIVYPYKDIVTFINTLITPTVDFYRVFYLGAFSSEYGSVILSNTRFEIQRLATENFEFDLTNNSMMEDIEDEQSKYEQ